MNPQNLRFGSGQAVRRGVSRIRLEVVVDEDALKSARNRTAELVVEDEAAVAEMTRIFNDPEINPILCEDELKFLDTAERFEGGTLNWMGLSLARQIALSHGGRLEYRPRASGGAAFRLSLPAE